MLSNCCNLEWLRLARCHLDDELKVDHPLPHLLHLEVMYSRITKINFCAVKLSTFVYKGQWLPIDVSHSSELKSTHISAILNTFPNVQNMTLCFFSLKAPWVLDNPCRFSQLKHLQLLLFIPRKDLDKILSLTALLAPSPFLQKLEVHFCIYALWPFDNEQPMVLRSLSPCQYSHLKDVLVSGYKGAVGQLEFLAHIAENAPGLELLTVDTVEALWNDIFGSELSISLVLEHHVRDISLEHHVREVAASYLRERLAPATKLCVI